MPQLIKPSQVSGVYFIEGIMRVIGHLVLLASVPDNARNGGIVHVANSWKQVVLNLEVQATRDKPPSSRMHTPICSSNDLHLSPIISLVIVLALFGVVRDDEERSQEITTDQLKWQNELEKTLPAVIVKRKIEKHIAIEELAKQENNVVDRSSWMNLDLIIGSLEKSSKISKVISNTQQRIYKRSIDMLEL